MLRHLRLAIEGIETLADAMKGADVFLGLSVGQYCFTRHDSSDG